MLRIYCRTDLCNDADPLRPEVQWEELGILRPVVQWEELGIRGGKGWFCIWAPAGRTCAVAWPTRYQCWCSPENNNTRVGDMNL
ncbi:hypothetical protein DPMN_098977 [Dreissena polymorpha]|uniref:Uncharacterized protein n=1 Tax=Dreissena polymorpha TaxID=45954 RepID=A0A9D4LEM8_DREPO|nr:hypothetical protein DPMN_098977 [Dreissena polymorpha]